MPLSSLFAGGDSDSASLCTTQDVIVGVASLMTSRLTSHRFGTAGNSNGASRLPTWGTAARVRASARAQCRCTPFSSGCRGGSLKLLVTLAPRYAAVTWLAAVSYAVVAPAKLLVASRSPAPTRKAVTSTGTTITCEAPDITAYAPLSWIRRVGIRPWQRPESSRARIPPR
jgi:hypothetical protein